MKIKSARINRNKHILLVLIPVILITLLLLSLQVRSGSSNVAIYTAYRGEFIVDIRERGDLETTSQIIISAPDNIRNELRITDLVPDGSIIEKGDFLVQFDTSEAEDRVTRRKDTLENAQADFVSTQARIESNMKELENAFKTQQYSYEQAKIRFEMMKYEAESRLREGELNLKQAELALKQAEAKIESQKIIDQADCAKAEVSVKQAEMRYNQALERLNNLTINSPRAGFVVLPEIYNRSTSTREKIKIGDSPHRRMPILSIPDLSKMIVKTKVNEVDIRRVKVGQKVVITLDALQDATYYGTVTNVATLAHRDEGSDIKVFDIEVAIENTDKHLKPGMTAQCTIITDRISNQLIIPLDSVFEKGDTTVVYVKDGGFEQRVVKVGKKNSNFIIIENGLDEGEEVALRDPTIPLKEFGTGESIATTD